MWIYCIATMPLEYKISNYLSPSSSMGMWREGDPWAASRRRPLTRVNIVTNSHMEEKQQWEWSRCMCWFCQVFILNSVLYDLTLSLRFFHNYADININSSLLVSWFLHNVRRFKSALVKISATFFKFVQLVLICCFAVLHCIHKPAIISLLSLGLLYAYIMKMILYNVNEKHTSW